MTGYTEPDHEGTELARVLAAMANPGPLRVLLSEHWKDRAEAAEAKLAEVAAACRSIPTPIADRILAIIGTEEPRDA